MALCALVGVAVASPWAFGAVGSTASLLVTLVGLAAAAGALLLGALSGGPRLPAVALGPAAGFLCLGLVQLLPLPAFLHRLLAPGSFAVWHPAEPNLAAVLGDVARPVSLDPHTTVRSLAALAAWSLCAALAAPALGGARRAASALGVVAAGGFVLAAYAIVARARFGALLYGRFEVPTIAPFGPFVSKNHFAGWATMAALLALGLALGLAAEARRRRGAGWAAGGGAGIVVLALLAALAPALAVLVSLSRGGALALFAGTLVLLALEALGRPRPRGRRAVLVSSLSLAALLAAAVLWLAPAAAHERLQSLSGASFRVDTWRDTLRLAASSPLLGSGLGAFHDAYPRFKRGHGLLRVEHAESDYLEVLAESGLCGLALALAALVRLLGAAANAARDRERPRLRRVLGSAAAAALAALAVHSAFDFNLRIPSNAVLAALAAALAASAAGSRSWPLRPPLAVALAIALTALGGLLLLLPAQPALKAREAVRLAFASDVAAVRTLRMARAEAELRRLLAARPAHAESWLQLAAVRWAGGDAGSAGACAERAVWLDPERPDLRKAAAPFLAAPPGHGAAPVEADPGPHGPRLDPTQTEAQASAGSR